MIAARDSRARGIVKDAGDDPDATHGALIIAKVTGNAPGAGIAWRAGEGVGTVTLPGLPLPPGEPAINPVPRAMIAQAIEEEAQVLGVPADAVVEIAIPDGEAIARKTMNPRLGIIGGLSILGTRGIVIPFFLRRLDSFDPSRAFDVARAAGIDHVAGATRATRRSAPSRRWMICPRSR